MDGPERRLTGINHSGANLLIEYADEGKSLVRINAMQAPQLVEIDARSVLDRTVWSHLNTFTMFALVGRGPFSLVFSPCPNQPLKAQAFGWSNPAQFAYLDAENRFHVVEARAAEKGPFRHLASGRLDPNSPLTITFLEAEVPIFRVSLKDWANQASRQLSPTAGWGLPENSIEFGTVAPNSMQVYVSLAATSVGRGFDTVGHSRGVYLNRLIVEALRRKD
jgi:hypothetical protein